MRLWFLCVLAAALGSLGHRDLDDGDGSDGTGLLQIDEKTQKPRKSAPGAVIFYNLFIKTKKDIPRVRKIVHEQLNLVDHPLDKEIRINSIGALKDLSRLKLSKQLAERTKLIAHYDQGFEELTLHDLWSFCKHNGTDPEQLVVYLHSKGSFHKWKGQAATDRYYLTSGALSKECMHMPKTCNVCSSRMTPVPHPHTPGNMWAARCGYIAKLIDPKKFREKMDSDFLGRHNGAPWCVGRGRFSDEHWVNSHPETAPCDLDTNQSFVSGHPMTRTFEKELKKAPRFPIATYHVSWVECPGKGESLTARLAEYRYLYSQEPPKEWWGWRSFLQESK